MKRVGRVRFNPPLRGSAIPRGSADYADANPPYGNQSIVPVIPGSGFCVRARARPRTTVPSGCRIWRFERFPVHAA